MELKRQIRSYSPVVPSKTIPVFRPKRRKNHTLWGGTYLYDSYKGVPHWANCYGYLGKMVDYPITLLCLFFFYNTCFNSRQIRLGAREGRNSLIFPSQVNGAPKDVVFALFWSENGYRLCLFWSEFGYGF